MTEDPRQDIARMIDEGQPVGEDDFDPAEGWGGDGAPPEPPSPDSAEDGGKGPSGEVLAWCAKLDHSDTDNGKRLIAHFGRDLVVMAQDEVLAGSWLAWTGTHWDLAGGLARASVIVQRLGDLIVQEAAFLEPTPRERRQIAAAEPLVERKRDDLSDVERQLIREGESAAEALDKRRAKRRAFGVSSKNKARMEAALHCAGPRLRRAPDAFNPDTLRIACASHTLTFVRERDDECPDPEQERWKGVCRAEAGHRRDDWITAMVPQPWQEAAAAPRWRAFLERMLPDAEKRRTVQQFTGLGLLSLPVQFLMFHYGLGANGKSVFLETITRVLGPSLAIGLPRESIVGGSERASGGASPDIARLYGKRMVRILEVAGNVPLQEDMIKKLTGGEAIPVRSLYKGYFEFANFATPHMSGNDFPTIAGTDNGIWRRMLLVHWNQTIPEADRGDFEEVVGRFVQEEGAGILAWMIEGVCDYLSHGLVIAPSVRADTQHYREDMDVAGEFLAGCVSANTEKRVQAGDMYAAFTAWCVANARKVLSQKRFGARVKQLYESSAINGRFYYHGCELHDVPEAPQPQPGLDLRR